MADDILALGYELMGAPKLAAQRRARLIEEQAPLDLPDLVVPDPAPTRQQQWEAFAAANPHVEKILVGYAREVLAMGHRRVSMRMLWERLRFEYATQVRGDSTAALNNNHAPFFARLLMDKYPELAGVFATRNQEAA